MSLDSFDGIRIKISKLMYIFLVVIHDFIDLLDLQQNSGTNNGLNRLNPI